MFSLMQMSPLIDPIHAAALIALSEGKEVVESRKMRLWMSAVTRVAEAKPVSEGTGWNLLSTR